jgi:hypothetical protein
VLKRHPRRTVRELIALLDQERRWKTTESAVTSHFLHLPQQARARSARSLYQLPGIWSLTRLAFGIGSTRHFTTRPRARGGKLRQQQRAWQLESGEQQQGGLGHMLISEVRWESVKVGQRLDSVQ